MSEQKVVLITGAGSGNGSIAAQVFAREGYDVALHTGSNPEKAQALAEKIREETGRRVEVLVCGLDQKGAAHKLFELFREKFDRLDVLLNNAGVTKGGKLIEMTEETFDFVEAVDFKAAYFCVSEAGKFMVEKGIRGSIVIVSSNNHKMVHSGCSLYGSLKEALIRFTKSAAIEYAQYGIRVNCIAPGWITHEGARCNPWLEKVTPTIPLKRFVPAEELAQWALFLSSPSALSVTGASFDIDGGVRLMDGDIDDYTESVQEERRRKWREEHERREKAAQAAAQQ